MRRTGRPACLSTRCCDHHYLSHETRGAPQRGKIEIWSGACEGNGEVILHAKHFNRMQCSMASVNFFSEKLI